MANYAKLPGLTWDGTVYENEEMGTLEALLPTGGWPTAHAPAMTELPNGDLLCCWFAGTYEGSADVHIICSILPKEEAPGSRRWTFLRTPREVSRIRPFSTDRTALSGQCIRHSWIGRQARTICSIQQWCAARRVQTAAEPGVTIPRFSRRRAPSADSPFRFCPTADGSSPTGSAQIPQRDCPETPQLSEFRTMKERAGIW